MTAHVHQRAREIAILAGIAGALWLTYELLGVELVLGLVVGVLIGVWYLARKPEIRAAMAKSAREHERHEREQRERPWHEEARDYELDYLGINPASFGVDDTIAETVNAPPNVPRRP